MKFYRRLAQIKAISFDLDDTLYYNKPVMQIAEQKMRAHFSENVLPLLPESKRALFLDGKFWLAFRLLALQQQNELHDDVTALRLKTYVLGFSALGLSQKQVQQQTDLAMQCFTLARSDFGVDKTIQQLLAQLTQKVPLAAISNGNVDTKQIGIDHYFRYVVQAGNGIKQKPHPSIFHLVSDQLNIKPEQLLHVGDCGQADVYGAIAAGCQVAWLPLYKVGKPLTVLPHIELSDVTELGQLFD
jgi:HAD superfamily hydrolase (TIGR01549 family)